MAMSHKCRAPVDARRYFCGCECHPNVRSEVTGRYVPGDALLRHLVAEDVPAETRPLWQRALDLRAIAATLPR
jgi:hypothetical protein